MGERASENHSFYECYIPVAAHGPFGRACAEKQSGTIATPTATSTSDSISTTTTPQTTRLAPSLRQLVLELDVLPHQANTSPHLLGQFLDYALGVLELQL